MRIVIDIPKYIYEHAKEQSEDSYDEWDAMRAIANGTPLPEHHGRLIDADALYKSSRLCHTEEDGTACVEWREINDAPTIIEGSDSK